MEYEIKKSSRKTLAIEVTKDKKIIVRAPLRCSQKVIDSFVESNKDWLMNAFIKIDKRHANAQKYDIPDSEKQKYISLAKTILPEKTKKFGEIMGLRPSYVKITSAKTRFGSCNGKNGICYSYRLMTYPEEAIDYVVVHELAHITHKNHSKEFYKLIASVLPDYKQRERILKNKE